MAICYATENEVKYIRNIAAFQPSANYDPSLLEVLNDLDISSDCFTIITSDGGLVKESSSGKREELEDKENMAPLASSFSSNQSFEDGYDNSGKPLPLAKIADLSVGASGDRPLEIPTDDSGPSVRQRFRIEAGEALCETRARSLMSELAFDLRTSSPKFPGNGLALLLPFSDRGHLFNNLLCGLRIGEKKRALKVRCVKENVHLSQLPELQMLKKKMSRSQTVTREEYKAVYTLAALRTDTSAAHNSVQFAATWPSSLRLLDTPASGHLGQLRVRPLFGHPRSPLAFLHRGIQRLKLLVSVLNNQERQWPAEDPNFDAIAFSQDLLAKFARLSSASDIFAEKTAATENVPDPSSAGTEARWRAILCRRDRDVTEILWELLRGLDSEKHLQECMQALLKHLREQNIAYKVSRANFSDLAALLHRLANQGLRCLPTFLNGLALLIDAGLFCLSNDLAAVLSAVHGEHGAEVNPLQPLLQSFTQHGSDLRQRLAQLKRLHRACEFAALLSSHASHSEIAKDVRHALTVLQKEDANELVFHVPTSNLLHILRREAPTSWSVSLELGGSGAMAIKQLFKRSSLDVITGDLAKFTQVEIITKCVSIFGNRVKDF